MRKLRSTISSALTLAAAIAATFIVQRESSAQTPSEPFSYKTVQDAARRLAARPYRERPTIDHPDIEQLDYDRYQHIDFEDDKALWADDDLKFRVRFFHPGLYFLQPVVINEVVDGKSTKIEFDPEMFYYGKSGVDRDKLPDEMGFAGFRINFEKDWERDVSAFLGASYFRAVGFDWQYGLSARGLAIDSGLPSGEEFPSFTEFWMERPKPSSDTLVIHALLDSPSVTGAYRMAIVPGDTLTMDVTATVYPRKSLENPGIAPLTSMFQYGENDKRLGVSDDWRPEIHDSDGLSIWNGSDEWLWRPLTNPKHLTMNTFLDESPKGFGLMQRDRDFDHYQDDAVYYDKRPHLWVEPVGNWGPGSVSLLQIPTVDETFDNIVAFWNPAEPLQPGQAYEYEYKLYWGTEAPFKPELATAIATRTGIGGDVGKNQSHDSRRFVIDFDGDNLDHLTPETQLDANVEVNNGTVDNISVRQIQGQRAIRLTFDLSANHPDQPADVRLYVKDQDGPLTETYLYHYFTPERPSTK